MSMVVTVCTKDYGLMIVDKRAVSKPTETDESKFISDSSLKIRTLSNHVCLGFCGDRDIAAPIAFELPENKDEYLEKCAFLLQEKIKTIVLGEYPVHFLLLGKLRDGNEYRIITFSSMNEFEPIMHYPEDSVPAHSIALPTLNTVDRERQQKTNYRHYFIA